MHFYTLLVDAVARILLAILRLFVLVRIQPKIVIDEVLSPDPVTFLALLLLRNQE